MKADNENSESGAPAESEHASPRKPSRLPKLSLGMRVVAFVVGWGLVLVGVVGLALPGIKAF